MSLTCSYNNDGPEPGQTWWWEPSVFTIYQGKRRARCKSCGKMIAPGSLCLEWDRFKAPEHEVEVNIYGEDGEIPRASWFWCEPCGDQFFNLKELGFCPSADDEVSELLREYHEEYVVPEHGQMVVST